MTAIILFGLLCLATASLLLRTVLLIIGWSEPGRLAMDASAAAWAGFLPTAIEWACNLAMACVFLAVLSSWIAPRFAAEALTELLTRSPSSMAIPSEADP